MAMALDDKHNTHRLISMERETRRRHMPSRRAIMPSKGDQRPEARASAQLDFRSDFTLRDLSALRRFEPRGKFSFAGGVGIWGVFLVDRSSPFHHLRLPGDKAKLFDSEPKLASLDVFGGSRKPGDEKGALE